MASTVQPMHVIGIAGKAGAGKDTVYETVLQPRGYIRWQMTLHYKVWLASTGRYDWDDIFCAKLAKITFTPVRS